MDTIGFDDFLKVELRVGRVIGASVFEKARKPAYILHIDFGEALGVLGPERRDPGNRPAAAEPAQGVHRRGSRAWSCGLASGPRR